MLIEAGKVSFEGDTDCAEASEIATRARVKKLAMLLATVDAAMIASKEGNVKVFVGSLHSHVQIIVVRKMLELCKGQCEVGVKPDPSSGLEDA